MSKTVYDITVKTGQYKDKNGEDKNRYLQIGAIIETKHGLRLKIDSIPLVEGGWAGWAYVNEAKPKEEFPPDEDF